MPIMVEKKKWILYKHTSSYERIKTTALHVKNNCRTDISVTERYRMQERLEALNQYTARNPKHKPLDTMNHRINTLEYWMFGYEDKNKFMFSPLGNLFLKYINDIEKTKKIFVSMLFSMQFSHPANNTDKVFQLYPFRLIFKLLLDPRLSGKLFNHEVEYLVMFVETINENLYEVLVENILQLRTKSTLEMTRLFKIDEHAYVNTVYEWEYYTLRLLSTIGIFKKHDGDTICKLYHPQKANSKSNPTGRKATFGHITIEEDMQEFITKLSEKYSSFDIPLKLDDDQQLQIDIIKEIYSFYPKILLDEINESDELSELLELPKLIEKYSNNPDNETAYLFEEVLVDGFNLFYNVEARRIGGAGHTDIECLYLTKRNKFAVESKSTANKLLGINVGRLREHREEIGGDYTIIITSRYVPAARRDIKNTPNVIILASTFAEYLYNHIFHDVRDMDYYDFDKIILKNTGKDISKLISDMTFEKFAANG